MARRRPIDAASCSGGVVSDGTTTRTHRATGEALLVPTGNGGSWVGRITGSTGKSADGERVAEGLVVATKRSNARGAKGPCCSSFFRLHGRQGRDDKDAHRSARPEAEDLHQGEGRHGLALLGPAPGGIGASVGTGGVGGGCMPTAESAANGIGHITLGVKRTGERSAGKPPAPFDVAGVGDGLTAGVVRHSQRKRGVTDRPGLRGTAPTLDPTQEPLFQRRFRRPGDLRRELARLQEAVNTQHVHPRLGGQTPAQHRRGLRLQKLPASFVVPTGRLPLAEGRVTFIRRVSVAGTVTVLSQIFRVGKRHRGLYLRLVIDTRRQWLTAYLNGRVFKRWPYKLQNA